MIQTDEEGIPHKLIPPYQANANAKLRSTTPNSQSEVGLSEFWLRQIAGLNLDWNVASQAGDKMELYTQTLWRLKVI